MIGTAVVANGPIVLMTTAGRCCRICSVSSFIEAVTRGRPPPARSAPGVGRAAPRPVRTGVRPRLSSSAAITRPLRPAPPRIQTSFSIVAPRAARVVSDDTSCHHLQYPMMTSRVITYTGPVSRWRPDARQRLERAAVELFAEQGFAATTVPEITARAGLTTRTFSRHFADKREVLFGGPEIPALASAMIADAPASLDPVTVIFGGLQTVAETRFEGRREDLRGRRAIIRSDDSLRERDRRKRGDLSEAIRVGFAGRGVPATTAA